LATGLGILQSPSAPSVHARAVRAGGGLSEIAGKAAGVISSPLEKIALPLRAHNCDPANESPSFPKEENDAVSAFVRREIAAIKKRPDEATVVAEKIAQTQQFLTRRPGGVTLERFYREEIARHRSRPSCDNGQNRIRLKRQADHAIRQNRGQNFITVAKAGHSIAFGPTPIGRGIIEQPSVTLGPEPWVVTKISNSTEFAEFRGTTGVPGASREMH
jgi:hypothetical protein